MKKINFSILRLQRRVFLNYLEGTCSKIMLNSQKITTYFMALSIFKVEFFFSIAALFGYIYLGSDSSAIFIILMTGIGIINIGLSLLALLTSRKIKIRDIGILIGFPIFVLASLILGIISSTSAISLQQSQFNSFLAFSLPSLFIGYYLAKKEIDLFIPISIAMISITAGSIASILLPFISGVGFSIMGGASYQAASYYTAFAYGLNLYILLYSSNHAESGASSSLFIKFIQTILLLLQVIMVLIPGGRGAFVLMIVYSFMAFSKLITRRNAVKITLELLLFVFLAYIISKIFPIMLENPIFQRGFNRAVAFIGPGGAINWEGSSGRQPIYLESINLFKLSPVYGYGLYGYFSKVSYRGYPHNFFLEILLQGGLLYLTIWLFFLGYLARKQFYLIKLDRKNKILFYLGLYPAVMLMFSGSYLTDGLFWFVVSFLLIRKDCSGFSRIKN